MKNRVSCSVLLFIIAFPLGLMAQAPLKMTDQLPIDPNVLIGQLDNGIKYFIRQNPKPEKRVELRLVVNAGSLYEDDDQQGLAHFCEHMCFNGSENFEKQELVNFLESAGVKFGAHLNAYTSFGETVYMLQLPTDKPDLLSKGYQVLEDWAHLVTFADEEVEKERGVVIEEWRLGLGAQERMRQKYFPVMFKGSRYAERLPIGKKKIIEQFDRETLVRFYNDWYRPDLMAIVVVGDIDVKETEAKIKAQFSSIPTKENPRKREEYAVPGNEKPLVSIVTDPEAGYNVMQVIYKHPHIKQKTVGSYKRLLTRQLFNAMFNSRFNEIMQQPDAPFIQASAYYGAFLARTSDAFMLTGVMKENQMEQGLEMLMSENEKVKRFGFTATELEREKKSLLSYYEQAAKELGKTPSRSYASELVRHYLTEEPIPGIENEFIYAKTFLKIISH